MSIYWILLMFQSYMLLFNSQKEMKTLLILSFCHHADGESEARGD